MASRIPAPRRFVRERTKCGISLRYLRKQTSTIAPPFILRGWIAKQWLIFALRHLAITRIITAGSAIGQCHVHSQSDYVKSELHWSSIIRISRDRPALLSLVWPWTAKTGETSTSLSVGGSKTFTERWLGFATPTFFSLVGVLAKISPRGIIQVCLS